jgi:hypothetical protein
LRSARIVSTRRLPEKKQDCVNGKEETMTRTWVLLIGLALFTPAVDAADMTQGYEPWWPQPGYFVGFPPAEGLVGPGYALSNWGSALNPAQTQPGLLLDIATQIAQRLDAMSGMTGAGGQLDNLMARVSASVHEALNSLPVPASTGILMAQ